MHTIIGYLKSVELHDEHGLAQLRYEIEQRSRYGHHTIRALCCVGRTQHAHATAARIVEHAMVGAQYRVTGDCLAALDGQVWLMGVTGAVRIPHAHTDALHARRADGTPAAGIRHAATSATTTHPQPHPQPHTQSAHA